VSHDIIQARLYSQTTTPQVLKLFMINDRRELGGFCFDNLVCIDLALRKKLELHFQPTKHSLLTHMRFVVGHTVLYTQQKFDILSTTTNTLLQTKAKMKHLIRGLAIASVLYRLLLLLMLILMKMIVVTSNDTRGI